jgi:hypothetical protein
MKLEEYKTLSAKEGNFELISLLRNRFFTGIEPRSICARLLEVYNRNNHVLSRNTIVTQFLD